MEKDTIVELHRPAQSQANLSALLRDGTQRVISHEVQAKFEKCLTCVSSERLQIRRANSQGSLNWRELFGVSFLVHGGGQAPQRNQPSRLFRGLSVAVFCQKWLGGKNRPSAESLITTRVSKHSTPYAATTTASCPTQNARSS